MTTVHQKPSKFNSQQPNLCAGCSAPLPDGVYFLSVGSHKGERFVPMCRQCFNIVEAANQPRGKELRRVLTIMTGVANYLRKEDAELEVSL